MSPKIWVTRVKASLDALKEDLASKQHGANVNNAILALNSTIPLLEGQNITSDSRKQISQALRGSLTCCYVAAVFPALEVSMALFTGIYEHKVLSNATASRDVDKSPWISVLIALLSGILDFLEEHSTDSHKTAVARVVYPKLPTIFTSWNITASDVENTPNLSCALYQLLSETATGHDANQRTLRDSKTFGGKQLGLLLHGTKDFLSAEALWELFAKLLPSVQEKKGRKKRTDFIKDVLDSRLFAYSQDMVQIVETISTADWEVTFLKLIGIMARADISFPQPFDAVNFRIHGTSRDSMVYSSLRFYVEKSNIFVNIDEGDGNLESLLVPFSTIKRVKFAAFGKNKMILVTVSLSDPPKLGDDVIARSKNGDPRVTFSLHIESSERLRGAMRFRGMDNPVMLSEVKVSKAETSLSLDFEATEKVAPASTQEKVENISRLWNSHSRPNRMNEGTSPLYPEELKDPAINRESLEENISEMSDISEDVMDNPVLMSRKGKVPRRVVISDDDSDKSDSDAIFTTTNSAKQRAFTSMAEPPRQNDGKLATELVLNPATGLDEGACLVESRHMPEALRDLELTSNTDGATAPVALNTLMKSTLHNAGAIEKRQSPLPPRQKRALDSESIGRRAAKRVSDIERRIESNTNCPRRNLSSVRIGNRDERIVPESTQPRVYQSEKKKDVLQAKQLRIVPLSKLPPRRMKRKSEEFKFIERQCTPEPNASLKDRPEIHANAEPSTIDAKNIPVIGSLPLPSVAEAIVPRSPSEQKVENLLRNQAKAKMAPRKIDQDVTMIDLTDDSPNFSHAKPATILMDDVDTTSKNASKINAIYAPHLEIVRPPCPASAFALCRTFSGDVAGPRIQTTPEIQIRPRHGYKSPDIAVSRELMETTEITPRVVEVIGEITKFVTDKAANRLNGVRKELRSAQTSILISTGNDLQDIHSESIHYFNGLVDLEEEYANCRRCVLESQDDWRRAGNELLSHLKGVIQEHGRRSVSKGFPATLCAGPQWM